MTGTVLRLLVAAAAFYALILGLLWLFQGRLIHLPHIPGRELAATPAERGLRYDEVELRTEDGERLHGWFVPVRRPRATLLFLHGNAGNISHRLDSLELFHRLSLSVLIVDYRGYGRSSGHPDEEGLYRDAEAALRHLLKARGASAERIVVFGRSLGAAVAARLAAGHPVGAVIIESAFTSVADVAAERYPVFPVRSLLRYRYDTRAALRRVKVPVLVIHSRDDGIIPYRHGQRLYQAVSGRRELLTIQGAHDTAFLRSRRRYMAGIDAFLDQHLPEP